jgi:glycosyltransferase involved in cell wall biosynthesis
MLSRLARHSDKWDCTISGDGPDIAELKRRFALVGLCDRVKFIGWVLSKDVPELMNQHDVLLFPSKYEGFGTALIEAMAGGCVPVASRLPGITDWIIEDGVDGLLFPIGDVRRAVQHLAGLLSDRLRLAELRQRAQQAVGRFNLSLMAVEYYRLLCDIKSLPGNIPASERMDHFNLAEGLRPAWWYRIPEPIKDYLRLVREQVRVFVSIP